MMESRRRRKILLGATLLIIMVAAVGASASLIILSGRAYHDDFLGCIGSDIQQTVDGGYIIVGARSSRCRPAETDLWLLKTDSTGNKEWGKTYGGKGSDYGYSIELTADGGYIVAGSRSTPPGESDFNYTHKGDRLIVSRSKQRDSDVWLIKINSNGKAEWERTFAGSSQREEEVDDEGEDVQQTSDGGYIVVGWTHSTIWSKSDLWLIKTDANGNQQWNRTFGGRDTDRGYSIRQTTDRGYMITGETVVPEKGVSNIWLIKTDHMGNKEWEKMLGGEEGYSVSASHIAADGGYIILGLHNYKKILIKTDDRGNEEWRRLVGGVWYVGNCLGLCSDGGYIMVGLTDYYGDCLLIKTDGHGDKEWQKTFGGPTGDGGSAVRQTNDGGYIIIGFTTSFADKGSESAAWLIKTDSNGNEQWNKVFDVPKVAVRIRKLLRSVHELVRKF